MNWNAVKAIAAVVAIVLAIGGIVYSAGGDRRAREQLEQRVTTVERRIDAQDRDDNERDKQLSKMAESIEWIRRSLEKWQAEEK